MPANKFHQHTVDTIINALRMCMPRTTAAKLAGITDRTLRNWLDNESSEFDEFRERVAEAEAKAEQGLVAKVLKQTDHDWRAAQWMLQNRASRNWNKATSKVELEGSVRLDDIAALKKAMGSNEDDGE